MSHALSRFETLSTREQRDLDRVADRFEQALRAGGRPRIEDYLAGYDGPARAALLPILVGLEEEWREEDYRKRFAAFEPAWLNETGPATRERFHFLREHGSGGMGRVSVCLDTHLGREVAVKEVHPERSGDPAVVARLLQEARITGQLEHPGVVPVYELAGATPDRPAFYAMRFVGGHDLSAAIAARHEKRRAGRATPLDLLNLLNAFVSVCQTVAYAHSKGVIHRDLKPANVRLGDFGEVVVLDWGLSKRLDDPDDAGPAGDHLHGRTLQGDIKGTPAYMAPEAADGRADLVGKASDVYGLGAILYEILAGRPPFAGDGLLAQARAGNPERPGAHAADVPPGLEAACLKALSKDPAARHASAAELAGDVQRWRVEQAERGRAEQERERFFNLSIDLLCTVDREHRFRQVNPAWEQTLGWSREELVGRPYLDFIHPDDRDGTRAEGEGAAAGTPRPGFENRYRHRDGTYRWVSWTATLIPGEGLIYAVGRDVTERKRAEEALRRSRERFELAVLGSGDGLWDWDRDTGESFYSPRWKSMIGYEDHEIPHAFEEWEKRVHPDDLGRARAALAGCIDGGAPEYEVEYRFRHKDGSYRWILDRGVALRNAAGVVYRMAGSHTDLTERKRTEEALRESEARHRAALAELRAGRPSSQDGF